MELQPSLCSLVGWSCEDPLARCDKCKLMKKSAEVICEVCGRPLCEKHSVFEDGRWICLEHSSAPKKQGILEKFPDFIKLSIVYNRHLHNAI